MIFSKKKIKLLTKISLAIVVLLVILVIVLSSISIHQQSHILKEKMYNEKRSLAEMAAVGVQSALLNYNPNFFKTIIKKIMCKEDIIYCRIINPQGLIFMADDRRMRGKKIKSKAIETKFTIIKDDPVFHKAKVVISPLSSGPQRWTIWIGFSTSGLAAARNKMIYTNLKVAVLSILVGLLIAFFLAGGITQPVKQLLKGVKSISSGNLESRVNVETKDEIGELADSFNKMAEDLSNSLVSKEHMDNIIHSMVDSLIVTDAEGKIKTVNSATLDLLRYRKEEIADQPIDIVFEKKRKEEKEKLSEDETSLFEGKILKDLIKSGFVSNIEINYFSKEGKKIPVIFSGSAMKDYEGKVVNMVWVARDITELKKSEEEKERLQTQLIQSEKMAGIGTLTSGIAHEFNNLLQIMRGHSEFALITKKDEDTEEALNIVLDTSDKVAGIIGDLLTFSRQEAPEKEMCDISETIESVLSLTEEQLKKNNIQTIRKFERVPEIEINKGEMQQVFFNIITNARDAMLSNGGKLKIRICQDDKDVAVSIVDTGEGIEKKNLSKVFEPFYTTKGAVGGNSELQGTGLGLSVSYAIVQRHGGTIEVESGVNQGSTFTVKLPTKVQKQLIQPPLDQEKRDYKRIQPLNILVVDDEEEICNMFIKWLSGGGHKVKAVTSGKEAVIVVKKDSFHVVFLDIVMPGIQAVEILNKIKKISPKTKVVMVTGKLINKHLINELSKKGASGFLQKPFKLKEIFEIIGNL